MVRLQTLGELGLWGAAGQELRSLLVQPKRVALLTYLAVAKPRGFHRRDSLLALLWPDQDAFHARAALRQVIHSLRHSLGEQALLARGEDLALDPAHFTCDVWSFEEAAQRGEHESAASIYGGEFLPGFFLSGAPEFEQWVETERRRLSQAYAAELQGLAEEATGRDPALAVNRWRQLAEHDPYSPRIALRLMQALDAAGDAPAAILHAEQHAALLREELDAEPDPEVSALADGLRSRPAGARVEVAARPQVAAESIETSRQQAAPSASDGAPPAARADGRPSRAARRPAVVGAGVVLVLACLGIYAAFFRSGHATREAPITSVAVLPFKNLSHDPENEYFGDGLSEALLDRLAKVPELKVAARTSSFYFKGRNLPVQEIARRLEVDAVFEGSVQRAGGRIRLTAQLVSGRTGYHLWSGRYDREAGDLFAVQDEIAHAVASALRVRMSGTPPRRHVPDSAAYDLYLRGRFFYDRGSRLDLERSVALLQQAIARDSGFAEPYAAAASAWVNLADAYVAPLQAYPQAEALARRALALDEGIAEAHANLGYCRIMLRWDWPGAEREFRRALELNPKDATAHEWYSQYLLFRGNPRQALAENQEAARLEPFSAYYAHSLVSLWWLMGELDSAIVAYRHAQEIAPGFVYGEGGGVITDVYRAKGRYAEALALDSSAAKAMGRPGYGLVQDLVALGRRAEAEATLDQMIALSKTRYVAPELIALSVIALGRRQEALDWLERGVEVHSAWAVYSRGRPEFRPLLSDPRYQRLLRRMGVEDLAH